MPKIPSAPKIHEEDWVLVSPNASRELYLVADGRLKFLAIHEIKGDTLRMCWSHEEGKVPSDFTAERGSRRTLLVMKARERR